MTHNKLDRKAEKRAEYFKLEESNLDNKKVIDLLLNGFDAVSVAIEGLKKAANIDNSMLDKKTKDAIKDIKDISDKKVILDLLKTTLEQELNSIDEEQR